MESAPTKAVSSNGNEGVFSLCLRKNLALASVVGKEKKVGIVEGL